MYKRQGFTAIKFGKTNDKVYTDLTSEHPIDLCRYQVANGYMGRVGLINSGGESHGSSDLKDAIITAIVNKRAGGMGLISGRKAFQKPKMCIRDSTRHKSTKQSMNPQNFRNSRRYNQNQKNKTDKGLVYNFFIGIKCTDFL